MSQGYAIVDVDEDESGGLQFKTYLNDAQDSATTPLTGGGGGSSRAATGASFTRDTSAVPHSFFNLAYYQVYFDVDTSTVLRRVAMSMIPRGGFIADACDGQVDMYGPFWTLTSLILVLYTTSTLTRSISQYLAGETVVTNIPLLSTATTLIYIYGMAVPALLWAATKWLGVGEWGPAEALGIYGYAMSVFVPVSLLCLIPVGIVRWVLVGLGALSSGFFLVTNIYPVLAASEHPMLRFLVIGVGALHAGMALAMKILFYSYSVGGVNAGPDPIEAPLKRALEFLS
ncbi:uncharacterized protein EHS24_008764 [Apiotrichum porosum]|uniref:Protein YIP n=1 Tax=Apiotrichum porosum TaxID=105984 RepID=A0A427XRA3_9TREE|nr:uncharacterized protein EHS24_008764 [Apiotrichum porosum]RSH81321.1 hypothetical protein EHS24_008764 [Apiotrichum porosum]